MNVQIEESWKAHLQPEFEKDYFRTLTDFVRDEYGKYAIYPPGKLIFNAFNLCPFDKVKVVIIGQDPYHGPGQAHGLCFSVNDGVPFPPSLLNIFKEIKNDIGTDAPTTGNLTRWAEQGILLLNATLTVRAHQAGSHQNRGWETFTDAAIRILAEEKSILYLFFGEPTPNVKGHSSTVADIWYSPRHIHLPYPLITASSGTSISAKQTSICGNMERRK